MLNTNPTTAIAVKKHHLRDFCYSRKRKIDRHPTPAGNIKSSEIDVSSAPW